MPPKTDRSFRASRRAELKDILLGVQHSCEKNSKLRTRNDVLEQRIRLVEADWLAAQRDIGLLKIQTDNLFADLELTEQRYKKNVHTFKTVIEEHDRTIMQLRTGIRKMINRFHLHAESVEKTLPELQSQPDVDKFVVASLQRTDADLHAIVEEHAK